ncbi:MAG: hypothetical protein GXP55_10375 [Deltaproteobacteria bacterium]|nr:hypothetical protein [Deltaproteobacteria bacterium]
MTRHATPARLLSLGLLSTLGLLSACLPGQIEELQGQASTRVVNPSSSFGMPFFGQVVAGLSGTLEDGSPASRLVVTAGADTPFAFYDVEDDGAFDLRDELFSGCIDRAAGCDGEFGVAAVGLPSFSTERLCTAFGAPGAGTLDVVCESLGPIVRRVTPLAPVPGAPATELGRGLAAMPASTPWGVAIAGAPGTNALYVLSASPALEPLTLPESLITPSGRLGQELAVAALPAAFAAELSEAVLVAVTQPGVGRLVLLSVGLEPAIGTTPVARLLGCIDGLTGDVSVAAGDVTGDGVPEVFFSDSQGPSAMTHFSVRKLSLADLRPENGCGLTATSDDPPTRRIMCPDLDSSISCAGFGETLALGDLDADGDQDLLVGAPYSEVAGRSDAGAVYVFPSTPSGFGDARVLVDSAPDSGARLGASLSTVKTGLTGSARDEPLVGAPGANRVFVFLCSGIPGDSAGGAARCLP